MKLELEASNLDLELVGAPLGRSSLGRRGPRGATNNVFDSPTATGRMLQGPDPDRRDRRCKQKLHIVSVLCNLHACRLPRPAKRGSGAGHLTLAPPAHLPLEPSLLYSYYRTVI